MVVAGQVDAASATGQKAPSGAKAQTPSSQGRWRETASMATERVWHTATRLQDGKVLIVGGAESESYLNSVELYDPDSNNRLGSWTTVSPLSIERAEHAAVLLSNGKVFVAGGATPSEHGAKATDSVEIYDPTANEGKGAWAQAEPLKRRRWRPTVLSLPNGKLFITGGADENEHDVEESEVYDPAANDGKGESRLTTRITGLHYGISATLLQDGNVFLVGRSPGIGGCHQAAYVVDPFANEGRGEWAIVSDGMVNLCEPTTTLLSDGTILIVGWNVTKSDKGYREWGTALRYDPTVAANDRKRAWKTIPLPKVERFQHTATLLPNGRVLIVGGERLNSYTDNTKGFLASAEIYIPNAQESVGAWVGGGSMKIPRSFHTATLLSSGAVLVVGGRKTRNDEGAELASAEIYEPVAVK